jgi:hypothetical protein
VLRDREQRGRVMLWRECLACGWESEEWREFSHAD